MRKSCLFFVVLIMMFVSAASQNKITNKDNPIRLNQTGFYPYGPKLAVVAAKKAPETFYIISSDLKDTVFKSALQGPYTDAFSGKTTFVANFSSFHSTGNYRVFIPAIGSSYPFKIDNKVYHEVAKGTLKAFYFIRCSEKLLPAYAGKWAREEGHPDTSVIIHPSAASAERPAGTVISSPGGWYDAGDYNKYIVNSGITTATLLSLYEDFHTYCDTLQTNIPESHDNIPDLLNEILWNLRWMLTMQDPNDGGVYHKLTNASFDKMEMPAVADSPRYVVQKSTAATLDFAAVMAQATRVFKHYAKELPELSDSCANAALQAWNWARKNPGIMYNQNAMNRKYDPDITTGAYGDFHLQDEWIWAASELYITTRQDSFYTAVNLFPDNKMPLPSWGQVRLLGYYSLLHYQNQLTALAKKNIPQLKKQMIIFADSLLNGTDTNAYQTVMGKSARDFIWGSNAVAANEGIALIQAYLLTNQKKYFNGTMSNLDYLLGRNATGYSFVTGFGSKTPMHPHHRPSVADGITDPVPGLLAGGPNPGQQDHCTTYTTHIADESYIDDSCAYACNEIAINWNAPMVYLLNAIEALQYQLDYSKR